MVGVDWKIWIDIYIVLCKNYITKESQLYSSGNSTHLVT